ncbi:hypothetical protein D3C87_266460 [compost metagenome]
MGNNEWLDIDVLDDYLEGKLDASMMHKVERISLEDPFVAQALAGLTEAKKRTQTLSFLQKQLQERVAEKPVERKMWRMASHRLSIAATAAVLFLTVSVLFWMRERHRQEQVELASNQPKNIEIDLKADAVAVVPADTLINTKSEALAVDPKKVEQALGQTLAKGNQAIAKNNYSKENTIAESPSLQPRENIKARLKKETNDNQAVMVGARIAAPAPPVQALESRVEGIQVQTTNAKLVKGVVLDINGRPIAGAEIKMVGNDLRTITNMSGEFALSADKQGDKVALEVASLGFAKKNVEAKTNEQLNIRLEENNNALSEVVVVGYGEAKKKSAVAAKGVADEVIIGIPEIGWKAYSEYLAKNNKLYVDGSKTVILGFKVLPDGSPSDIKVVKSEGKATDEEAIRLLKNGGKWKLPTGTKTQTSISIKF